MRTYQVRGGDGERPVRAFAPGEAAEIYMNQSRTVDLLDTFEVRVLVGNSWWLYDLTGEAVWTARRTRAAL